MAGPTITTPLLPIPGGYPTTEQLRPLPPSTEDLREGLSRTWAELTSPRLPIPLLPTTEDLLPLLPSTQDLKQGASRTWADFRDFALRDNVLEVAVGLVLAAVFTSVVTSFVNDILLPPLALLPGFGSNLNERFAVLRYGLHGPTSGGRYLTVQQALDDGAIVMAYG